MTRGRYIAIVAILYVATFVAVFLILDSRSVQPIYEAVPILVGGSVFLAWMGTLRAMQWARLNQPPFALPSLVHGLLISMMLGGAIYLRVYPSA